MLERTRRVCPYLDRRDCRCADLHTLTNLREAFRLCAGDHESCATYHKIRIGDRRAEAELCLAETA